MQIQPMISTHPDARGSVNESLVRAIDAAYASVYRRSRSLGCLALVRLPGVPSYDRRVAAS